MQAVFTRSGNNTYRVTEKNVVLLVLERQEALILHYSGIGKTLSGLPYEVVSKSFYF